MKGSTGRFTVDKVMEFMEEVGDVAARVVLVKTDQEPSITSLMEDVVAAREETFLLVSSF